MGDNVITGWEPPDVLIAALVRQVTDYANRIQDEELTVTNGGVTVVIGLDGFLTEVRVEPRLRNRCPADELAAQVLAVIGKAERAARERRDDLTNEILANGELPT